ncbi:type II toxin-antitoxin system RelE/ParE family toxin [Methylacidimicrobium sp. B4]|uniref:type II toxin-antitoxin system RelE family toxin n=1 Tax=Methylacidimicrobium sp. B4 TaxID=2796139 RepID=UPI001A8EAAEF|nr:type II toxin-antitoxin system RelE/ParE family toxin [Methylacidimicrobium sp. B4]QSR85699.1 type II toxin-antitoxin system RelE/ParE family toxin [Methylacidimicrobium sp. B4]
MAWRVELSTLARKTLEKLDPPIARRILLFLHERVAPLDDPRGIGERLQGPRFGELWRYRVGDYRLIAKIEDGALRILVLLIGHRRNIYRKQP